MKPVKPETVTIELPNGALGGWHVLIRAFEMASEKTGLKMVFGGLIDQINSQLPTPKPDEPTGLGAVVEDEHGNQWVRTHATGFPWHCALDRADLNLTAVRKYADIAAVKVLSKGVVK